MAELIMNKPKPCPFCGSENLDISSKTACGALMDNRIYRVAVYCKKCNAYGPRVVVNCKDIPEQEIEEKYDQYLDRSSLYGAIAKNKAIEKWNDRR